MFLLLADKLDAQETSDVWECMSMALASSDLPPRLRDLLESFGRTLGCFDLEGQLRGVEVHRQRCLEELEILGKGKEDRLRSYQTLGLCAGAALVILFV